METDGEEQARQTNLTDCKGPAGTNPSMRGICLLYTMVEVGSALDINKPQLSLSSL